MARVVRVVRNARGLFVLFAATFAFAFTMLAPSSAHAVIIQTCEHDAVTMMPAQPEASCDPSAAEAGAVADGNAAPICDPSGASAVAPPRLMPIADGRIEAAPTCLSFDRMPGCAPGSGDQHITTSPAIVEHALLAGCDIVRPASLLGLVELPEMTGGPLPGVAQDVYHPPR